MDDLARRFGRLVALHRKTKGWTQQNLADGSGVSPDMIAKLETGVAGARFGTITKLATDLEVDPSELFFSQVPRNGIYQGKRGEIAKLVEELPEKELDWAYDLLILGRRIMQGRPTPGKPTKAGPKKRT